MTQKFSRRSFLASSLAVLPIAACAEAPSNSLRPVDRPAPPKPKSASDLVSDAGITGVTAFALADARTGRRIAGSNDTALLPPASVAKIITGLYALDVLGPNFRFGTEVVYKGTISNGVLNGDLVLRGNGDPLLDTDGLNALVKQVKAAGINKVVGRFIVDASAIGPISMIDAGQPAHVGYNPAVSGINLNYNRVHFEWKKEGADFAVAMEARSENLRPNVRSSRMRIVDRAGPVYAYEDAGSYDSWTVARGALNNFGSRWLPTRKPKAHVAEVFTSLANSNGLALPKAQFGSSSGGTRIAFDQGAELPAVVRGMLKFSTNLTAEVLGLTASKALGGNAGSLKASAKRMNQWVKSKYGVNVSLVDHSGLGDKSRVTAKALVDILTKAHQTQSDFEALLKPIPMRDEKGNKIAGHPAKVMAKTGTLNFVSALAGYVRGADGRAKAFAIVSGDVPRRKSIPKENREKPRGAKTWNTRSKRLQQKLLQKWALL